MAEALVLVRTTRQSVVEAGETFERYLAHLGVGGSSNTAAPARSEPALPLRQPLSLAARKLVTEVESRGDKITPELVIRIEQQDRIVWLEEGDKRAELFHILTDKRVADFARHGIGRGEIVDAVFTALANGTPIGITGRDRVVYVLTYQDHPVRVAVSVGSNGLSSAPPPSTSTRK